MRKYNAENERIKRRYELYLREAKGQDVKSIDTVRAALVKFEQSTKLKPFKKFNIEQARQFKDALAQAKTPQGKPSKPGHDRCDLAFGQMVLSLACRSARVQKSSNLFSCKLFQ